MEIPETTFQIIFNIVRAQNRVMLREIALRENIPFRELMRKYQPSQAHFREFMKQQSQASSSSSSSTSSSNS